jgi:hypothetical protein
MIFLLEGKRGKKKEKMIQLLIISNSNSIAKCFQLHYLLPSVSLEQKLLIANPLIVNRTGSSENASAINH